MLKTVQGSPNFSDLLRRLPLVAALSIALVAGFGPAAMPAQAAGQKSCTTPRAMAGAEATLLNKVNRERRARGLSGLRPSTRLAKVAQAHACDNAARETYSHVGSDGSDLRQRLKRGGYKFRVAAENTARGFDTADLAVAFWMKSPHHRENILNPKVTEFGLGLAAGARPNWVLLFARPR